MSAAADRPADRGWWRRLARGARGRLDTAVERARASYWLLPGLMVLLAIGLGVAMTELDRRVDGTWVRQLRWLYRGGTDGAREVLSTAAAAMLGLAGVTFSITIVTLTLAANNFGPRLLRAFTGDRGNQAVLGTYISTFLYCLIALRAVHGDRDELNRFVPHLSVTLAVALAVTSIGVFIYFIHHIAFTIQAPNVIAAVSAELHRTIDRMFPEELGRDLPPNAARSDAERQRSPTDPAAWAAVASATEGYVQRVDEEEIMRLAVAHDLIISIAAGPHGFIAEGEPLLQVWPPERLDDSLRGRLRGCILVDAQPSQSQDLLFPIDQLVEMALRAQSPSMNDPYTASQCAERLGVALARLAGRAIPTPYRADEDGRLRVVAHPFSLADALAASFDPIRDSARGSALVYRELTRALERIAAEVRRPEDREVVASHAAALLAEIARYAGSIGRGQAGPLLERLRGLSSSTPA